MPLSHRFFWRQIGYPEKSELSRCLYELLCSFLYNNKFSKWAPNEPQLVLAFEDLWGNKSSDCNHYSGLQLQLSCHLDRTPWNQDAHSNCPQAYIFSIVHSYEISMTYHPHRPGRILYMFSTIYTLTSVHLFVNQGQRYPVRILSPGRFHLSLYSLEPSKAKRSWKCGVLVDDLSETGVMLWLDETRMTCLAFEIVFFVPDKGCIIDRHRLDLPSGFSKRKGKLKDEMSDIF